MSKGVQHKMYEYEVSPPTGTWDKIAAALDESELSHEFPSKLYGAEVIPAPGVWDKIGAALDAEITTVPERRRIAPWIRYAAAAAIVGLLFFGGRQIFKNNSTPAEETATTVPVKKNDLPPLREKDPATDLTTTNPDEARDDAALEASKTTFASLEMSVSNRIKQSTRHYIQPIELSSFSATDVNPAITYEELPCNDIEQLSVTHSDRRENMNNRYITLMTPDGNIIRMSKKWSNLVCCVAGEEEDQKCKDQLKKWREKITTSALAPSSNFIDMLHLVNSLQENKL